MGPPARKKSCRTVIKKKNRCSALFLAFGGGGTAVRYIGRGLEGIYLAGGVLPWQLGQDEQVELDDFEAVMAR